MGHGDDGPGDGYRAVAAVQIADEGAIDFQYIDGEFLQIAQGRVAGAEVVDGDGYAERPQLAQGGVGAGEIVDDGAFGDFDFQAGRCQAAVGQGLGNHAGQILLQELAGGEVDRHPQIGQSGLLKLPGLAAGLLQHPAPQAHDHAGLFGHGDEFAGGDQPPLGMLPAYQGLAGDQGAVGAVVLGLKVQLESAVFQSQPQIGLQGHALHRLLVHGRSEHLIAVAAESFGPVQGQIGVFHQGRNIFAIQGKQGDADTGGEEDLLRAHRNRQRHGVEQFLGDLGGVFSAVDFGEQNIEAVAGKMGRRVAGADAAGDPFGEQLQRLVADPVAVGVVDTLEVVDVEGEHRQHFPAAQVAGQTLTETVAEQPAVWQFGEGVVKCQEPHCLFGLSTVGDILGDLNEMGDESPRILDRKDGSLFQIRLPFLAPVAKGALPLDPGAELFPHLAFFLGRQFPEDADVLTDDFVEAEAGSLAEFAVYVLNDAAGVGHDNDHRIGFDRLQQFVQVVGVGEVFGAGERHDAAFGLEKGKTDSELKASSVPKSGCSGMNIADPGVEPPTI